MKFLIILILIKVTLLASIGKIYAIRGDATFSREGADIKIKLGDSVNKKDVIRTEIEWEIKRVNSKPFRSAGTKLMRILGLLSTLSLVKK